MHQRKCPPCGITKGKFWEVRSMDMEFTKIVLIIHHITLLLCIALYFLPLIWKVFRLSSIFPVTTKVACFSFCILFLFSLSSYDSPFFFKNLMYFTLFILSCPNSNLMNQCANFIFTKSKSLLCFPFQRFGNVVLFFLFQCFPLVSTPKLYYNFKKCINTALV